MYGLATSRSVISFFYTRTMFSKWLPRVLVITLIALVFALFRWMAPPSFRTEVHANKSPQLPEPFPSGLVGAAMWCLGIVLALGFFLLRAANHLWASLEGPALLTQYPPSVIWCFLPGFAALCIPWPLTVWYLRRGGRWEEADAVENVSDAKSGMDSLRVMKWLNLVVLGPIAILTLLAIPIHLSVGDSEVRVGHYASLRSETFCLRQARRLTIVDGYSRRKGRIHKAEDVIIDFADGRRLRGNQVGDGGTSIRRDLMRLLIAKSGLAPEHEATADQIQD